MNASTRARVVRLVLLVILLVGCTAPTLDAPLAGTDGEAGADRSGPEGAASEPMRVVATTSILGDIVRSIAGDHADVEVVIPAGVDPHGFEPSAAVGVAMREADLVVANGLQLEDGLESIIAAAAADGATVFTLADKLDPIPFDGGEHDDDGADDDHDAEDDHDEHDHGPLDPHVWFDPVRMTQGAELLAAALADADTVRDGAAWSADGEAYAAKLRALHDELEATFGSIPRQRRVLVTNHDSLGYLAARYDLTVLGTVVPGASTHVAPDARAFAALIEQVAAADVRVIFVERTDAADGPEQLAREVTDRTGRQVEVVALDTDALTPPGTAADTYLGLLETTANTIAEALGAVG
ncbi:MAG: zinc ABC transporter substrate-binding protein [Nitriliruptoraceae bacterium]